MWSSEAGLCGPALDKQYDDSMDFLTPAGFLWDAWFLHMVLPVCTCVGAQALLELP